MSLEVIDKGRCTSSQPIPLLFVHGGWHAAWCWDEHFLDYFASNGFRALALSLRGHGGSPKSKLLNRCSIIDYVSDLKSVIENLPTTPVIIGHSMGGFVVQKYLESHGAPAAVLLASTPPRALIALYRAGFRHPLLALKMNARRKTLAYFDSAERAREFLFCDHTPDDIVRRCYERLGDESFRALFFDMPLLERVRIGRVMTPMLVLGGQDDRALSRNAVCATARAYRVKAEFFPQMGHNLMLEPGWAAVAERIRIWVASCAASS